MSNKRINLSLTIDALSTIVAALKCLSACSANGRVVVKLSKEEAESISNIRDSLLIQYARQTEKENKPC